MPTLYQSPRVQTNYNSDLRSESKSLIKMIKSNMESKAEAELELLEAGSVKNKLKKFDNKIKKSIEKSKD
jgi:hypothetical protein